MKVTSFLHTVAKRVLTLDAQKTIVVMPNRRAGLFLRKAIAQQIDKPNFLPQILTIEEFFMQLSGLVKVEQVEQLFRLYESHKVTHNEPDNFDKFLTWAPTFLADCGEIDTNLIDEKIFFKTLYSDKEIRNWNVAEENTEMQKKYLAFWQQAEALYTHFRDSLLNDGRAYNGLAYRIAIQNIKQNFSQENYVLFAGFNALNRAEEALFDYVYENGVGEFLWDFDSYYVDDEENKAGMYFRERYRPKYINDKALQQTVTKIGEQTENIQIIEAPNNISQCEIAATIVAELAQNGQFNEKTAIVLADEQLLQPLLYQLPKNLGSYNITMGKAVSQFPIYHLFYDYFSLQNAVAHRTSFSGYPISFVKPLILSPFVRALEEANCRQLYKYLLENNISFLKKEMIDAQILTGSFLYKLLQPVNSVAQMVAVADSLIELLRVKLYNAEGGLVRQVLFEIKKILQQFTSFEVNLSEPLGVTAFRNLFRQVARATRIPYEGEPLAGLQIMGVLETRSLDFDNVIILSANEGILPKGKSANSFIPHIFKKEFKIQTFQDKDAIYAYSIYRLLHTVKNLYFVYNGQPDIQGGGEMSRFVTQIEAEFPQKIKKPVTIQKITATFSQSAIQKDDYQIEKTEEIQQEIKTYLENKGLSPSALKQLISAPLDFYFQRIAGIKEPKEFEQDIEVSTLGTIVHNTLEELYKPLIGEQLTEEKLDVLLSKIDVELENQIKKEFKKGVVNSGKNYLYVNAARTMVEQTILVDKQRIKTENIELLSVEEKLECVIEITIFNQPIKLKLHGMADRMQLRDNMVEIIDYKTGGVDAKKLKSAQIGKISEDIQLEKLNQLLCYIVMVNQGARKVELSKIASAMQPLKSWENGLSYIDGRPSFALTQDQFALFLTQIKIAIENILNPEQLLTPETDDKRLTFSAYKNIYL